MEDFSFSPVPENQIPLKEFIELKESIFFSWPLDDLIKLYKNIFLSWFVSLPLFIVICSGSNFATKNILTLSLFSILSSSIIPISILLRQYLGWSYIFNRLSSNNIFYEETDWHDGQVWRKPALWKVKDELIASQEVIPILSKIKHTILMLLSIIIITSITLLYINS